MALECLKELKMYGVDLSIFPPIKASDAGLM